MRHSCPYPVFYSSQRLSQRGCDFRMAHSLKIGHLDRYSLLFRKRLQSDLHPSPGIRGNKDVRFWRCTPSSLGILGSVPGTLHMLAVAPAQAVNGTRASNGEYPGDRFSAGGVIFGRLLPDLPEYIDQHVFRIGRIPHDTQNKAESDAVVAIIERVQRSGIPRCHALDQIAIFLFNTFVFRHGHVAIVARPEFEKKPEAFVFPSLQRLITTHKSSAETRASGTTGGKGEVPSLAKEGTPRHQANGPRSFGGAAGVVRSTSDNRWLEPTTPSAPPKELRGIFLMGAATPPCPRRGLRLSLQLFSMPPVSSKRCGTWQAWNRHHLLEGAATPPLQAGEYVLVQHTSHG